MQNNLERLIKQKVPFSSPEMKAQIGMLYLSYCMNSQSQKIFKSFDITLQQYNILRILRGQYPNPANISMLKDRMLDKMSDASRLVDRLANLGLVSRRPNAQDKRNTDVLITQKGLDLMQEIDNLEFEKNTLFHQIPADKVEQFNEIVDQLLGLLP